MDPDAPTNGFGNWSTARLYDLKVWQDYYRKLAAKTNFFPVARQPQTPAKDVLLALSRYDSTLEELDNASRLRYSRFPLDYSTENPAKIYPLYAQLKSCSVVLQLRAIAELQDGQSEKALKDIQLIFRLAESIHTEPLLPSQLARLAMIQIALQPVYEGLARHKWSDPELAEIDSDLATLDFLADFKFAMRSELVFYQQGIFDFLRRHPEELFNYDADYDPLSFSTKTISRLIPSGWFYQNQTRCARCILEDCIPAADLNKKTVSPTRASIATAHLAADQAHPNPYNFLEGFFLTGLEYSALRFAHNQSSIDLARVGIALERFRLAHGGYPNALADLTPQFLQSIPHDVINGQPLKYRRTNDGQFVLYSVGWDEKDDGGLVVLNEWGSSQNIKKGDWVWKYPAN
jgi:hypothetical protein